MRTTLVLAHNPGPMTRAGTCTWLIHGRVPTLVDAGTGEPRHLDTLEASLQQERERLASVLLTHAHADHMGGAAAIAARWPGTAFLKVHWPERDVRFAVPCAPLADGQRVPAGDDELVVLHTPGHSPDHACFWHEPTRTLFSGDLLIEGGTVVIPASRGGRLSEYLGSLHRVLALQPRRALPGHGVAIERPVALIRSYLVHRARREAQVLRALAAGPGTPDTLVPRIYDRLPPDLLEAAAESVRAHLDLLVEQGRAVEADGSYRLA
jgi:endoribonuclease LACTB2